MKEPKATAERLTDMALRFGCAAMLAMVVSTLLVVAGPSTALAVDGWVMGAEADESDGFPWPVAIIGGAIIIGGLIAVRSEFANWRRRRAGRGL